MRTAGGIRTSGSTGIAFDSTTGARDTGLWVYSVRDARNLLGGARSGTTHRLPIESVNPRGSKPLSFRTHEDYSSEFLSEEDWARDLKP